jgi:hypothetical protein
MSALDRVIERVTEKNFDNDIVSLIANLRRYGLENDPINLGSSSLSGSMVEFLLAMCDEIDVMGQRILAIEADRSHIEVVDETNDYLDIEISDPKYVNENDEIIDDEIGAKEPESTPVKEKTKKPSKGK